jgi:hypothetical protein
MSVALNDKELRPWEAWRRLPGSKDVNMVAEESTALGTVTKQQPVKTQQTEKT